MTGKVLQNLAQYVAKRANVFAQLNQSWDEVKDASIDSLTKVQVHFENSKSLSDKFEEINNKIIELNSAVSDDEQIETTSTCLSFQTLMMEIHAKYISLKKEQPPDTQPQGVTATATSAFKLPNIALPKFHGDLQSWPEFYALFTSLIHNNPSLTDLQRLHFLRANVSDDALAVISNFQLSDENYKLALDALEAQYQNPRRIANLYLNKIIDFKPITNNSLTNLKKFLISHQNSVQAIKALSIGDLSNFLLLTLSLRNLDAKTRKVFEERQRSKEIPKYEDLMDFVTQQIQTLEIVASPSPRATAVPVKSHALYAQNSSTTDSSKTQSSQNQKLASCIFCSKAHPLFSCSLFAALPLNEKVTFLKSKKRCFNCLGAHVLDNCQSTASCRKCSSKRHHTLLHPISRNSANSTPSPKLETRVDDSTTQSTASSDNHAISCIASHPSRISKPISSLLGTFRARILDPQAGFIPVRGVIDPGSQISFISQRFSRLLSIKMQPSTISVNGIGGRASTSPGLLQCKLYSRLSQRHVNASLCIIPLITNHLPPANVNSAALSTFNNLTLADPEFYRPDRIDILLGADVYPQILIPQPFITTLDGPVAINTLFGWTLTGPVPTESNNNPITSLISTSEISHQLSRFWEVENISSKPVQDPLDVAAEQHFSAHCTRDSEGRYSVALPLKPHAPPLQNNRSISIASESRLLKRLTKTPDLVQEYQNFMQEYRDLGHMTISELPVDYVIPHHLVTKVTNQGNKVRVVFNASSPDCTGISLNDRLLKGPKLQLDISEVLLNFRLSKIAICCDIQKMYRQVLVQPSDRYMQHIFWRPDPISEVQEFELNTVTYGLAPSAFLAVRVLHQLVHDEGHRFPLASSALLSQTYIDDIITGANGINDALELKAQLTKLLKLGGFELRKWSSSHPSVLQGLPQDHLESTLIFNDEDKSIKILGLNWNPNIDHFYYRVQPFEVACTKRNMLSFLARIFDPNGYLSPVTISFKIIIQKIWLAKLDWDDPVPASLQQEWTSLVNPLDLLTSLRIPRCALPLTKDSTLHLIGFADASEVAYAAVLYICYESSGSRTSFLWKAKTRVAPLKTLSIPRLELSAAVLLIDLVQSVLSVRYPQTLAQIRLFSDSQIVLSWIGTSPHLLKTFVANRVMHILDHSPPNLIWSHIESSHNPADMASRGLTPTVFTNPDYLQLWTQGPSFLNDLQAPWPPPYSVRDNTLQCVPDLKGSPVSLLIKASNTSVDDLSLKFSSLLRFQRVVAWILRFHHNCVARIKSKPLFSGPLSWKEISEANSTIVRHVQAQHLAEPLKLIRNGETAKSLCSLSPFLDENGILRVGGRLKNANLPYSSKHPILLPNKCHLATLICRHFHLTALHAGPSTCIALIRANYWILSIRQLIRKVIHECVTCVRFRASTLQPVMADLPSCRVQQGRPFITTGVDFAGPFDVRTSTLRKSSTTKGYLCIFVCCSTKAVHLEFASDLSSDCFLAAFDRFIARRGIPSLMLSDQGRNFVGANKRIQEVQEFLTRNNASLIDALSQRKITWQFNPPYAPNFGGLWEAAVKSAKNLLYRISPNITFTVEEYFTVFARIEAILNSRPLCPFSTDPNEAANYLSPGHFLIGAPLLSRSEIELPDDLNLHKRWKIISQFTQSFWRRWSRDYLNTLIQRSKWTKPSRELKVNDVVVVKELSSAPLSWPIAKIIKVLPGPDGIARVAVLKYCGGTLTRPLNKLIPLSESA